MKQHFFNPHQPPLVVEAEGETLAQLKQSIAANFKFENELLQHGAVLFRGFPVNTPAEFEQIAAAIDADLKNDYLGTSPRDKVAGTDYVFTASELPPFYPIMQHCEMSFLPHPPRKLFFYCHIEPQLGGETPICDFRKVYQQLSKEVLQEFETKGVLTVRNYSSINEKSAFNLFELKKWNQMFLTEDKKVVEQKCRQNGIEFEWHENDRLKLINRTPAVKAHPVSGEKAWFNHAQVFHLSASAFEYNHIHARQKRLKTLFYKIFTSVLVPIKKVTAEPDAQSMNMFFGDGTPIPDSYIQHIQETIWNNMSIFSWKKGDVLAIDNFSTSHGRLPYEGAREILVSWSA
ncbi:MAG: TauD/TfdA family dioxygenase [Chitinophagales bacterium]